MKSGAQSVTIGQASLENVCPRSIGHGPGPAGRGCQWGGRSLLGPEAPDKPWRAGSLPQRPARVRGREGVLIQEVQKSALARSSRVCLVLSASCPPPYPPSCKRPRVFDPPLPRPSSHLGPFSRGPADRESNRAMKREHSVNERGIREKIIFLPG